MLDEGLLKYIDESKMPTNLYERYEQDYFHNQHYIDEYTEVVKTYMMKLNAYKKAQEYMEQCSDVYTQEYYKAMEVKKPREPAPPLNDIKEMKHPNEMSKADIYEYYGIIQFNRSLMVNISPNWKGKFMKGMEGKKNFMKKVILKFFQNYDRFTKIAYAIECGSGADFTHAHLVLEFNPGKYKSTIKTHRKGNLMAELRKLWDKTSKELSLPFEGLLKGRYALQTTLINNREILEDKLTYLIEEEKPESHQNAEYPGYPLMEKIGFD